LRGGFREDYKISGMNRRRKILEFLEFLEKITKLLRLLALLMPANMRRFQVKNPGASPEAFNNMNSRHEEKPKQASGYQTQRE
jgi:hypothetical protein